MDQSQFAAHEAYPYFLSDVSYDLLANQYSSPIMTEDFHAPSPWSGGFDDGSSPTFRADDYDHDDHHDTASSASSPKHSSAHGHERHGSTGSDKSDKKSRANRYKNCSEAALSRRRAQNRENQRAYRKRKEERIVELQQQLDEMSHKNEALSEAYTVLSEEYSRLKARQQTQGAPQAHQVKMEASDWQPSSLLLDPKLLGSAAGTTAFPDQWWGAEM